ncbi:MAG: toll/interleukin-1 receptor domain-containing protein [Planctomycetes bacterium]|nr:toll/interleukin-1 receptor domain-containing protein [Planctomycetota bacterium]
MKKPVRKIRLFVSYSHLDRRWFEKLRPLLVFTSTPIFMVHVWHDNELVAGHRWDDEIRDELDRMDIFLCLVSSHFLASEYIRKVELPVALERERNGKTSIVPLLICDMDERDIQHLKPFGPLPAWGRSWRSFEQNGGDTMDAHKPIRKGLLDVIDSISCVKKPIPSRRNKK